MHVKISSLPLYPSSIARKCAWTDTNTVELHLSYHTEIFLFLFLYRNIIIDSIPMCELRHILVTINQLNWNVEKKSQMSRLFVNHRERKCITENTNFNNFWVEGTSVAAIRNHILFVRVFFYIYLSY